MVVYKMTRRQGLIAHLLALNAKHTWATRFLPEEAFKVAIGEVNEAVGSTEVWFNQGFVTGYQRTPFGWVQWDIYPNGDVTLHAAPSGEAGQEPDVIRISIQRRKIASIKILAGAERGHGFALGEVLDALGFRVEANNAKSTPIEAFAYVLLYGPELLLDMPSVTARKPRVRRSKQTRARVKREAEMEAEAE